MASPKIRDRRGTLLQKGFVVAYGRSNRNHPINIGTIEGFEYKDDRHYDYDIIILGVGNEKLARIPEFHANRIIVLPNHYLEEVL